jgi:NDP-sugar pyrophosphorylase family protein
VAWSRVASFFNPKNRIFGIDLNSYDEVRVSSMQIIIPMSGFGERFRKAGYTVPKPLIEIENKPIIRHVVEMFPGESDFIFICNQDHLDNPAFAMEETLREVCPSGRVVGIEPHKLGPVHAVLEVVDQIDRSAPVVVNYCDFTCYWDWPHFRKFTQESGCVGAIPAYRGFHPHTLGSTNYAYMREEQGWVLDIQEKQPYTDNRMEEFASSGTYYFNSGATMISAFRAVMDRNLAVNGEYYVSLAYKPLLAENKPVAVYELQHFMQWGTPEDVAEYRNWSTAFRKLLEEDCVPATPTGTVIIPMAGMGMRFVQEGYAETKPLIPVSGLPMVVQAARSLPAAERYVFVLRKDMEGFGRISEVLQKTFDPAFLLPLDEVTNGQATTALMGLDALARFSGDIDGPVTFGACDFGALYSREAMRKFLDDSDTDVIVWGTRGNANAARNPQMFGWIDEVDGEIRNISVKRPLGDPERDPIVLGTFSFRSSDIFRQCIQRLYQREGLVNGEYYLDSLINDAIALGMKCRLFEVDSYLSWGTPNDLRTFEYWQSCFHKWPGHPYRLEKDCRVDQADVKTLEDRYADFSSQAAGSIRQ